VGFGVIATVSLDAVGALARFSNFAAYRGERLGQGQQLGNIMGVRASQDKRKRNAVGVAEHMMLSPRFAPTRRVRPRFLPPKTARSEEEFTSAGDQSMASALCKRARRATWILAHTPSCCQAWRRRQQVMPLPHPISLGKSSHAMPERSTNRIPVSTFRLGTGGRPLLPAGLSGGNNGSINAHKSSGKISRATGALQCSRVVGCTRRNTRRCSALRCSTGARRQRRS